MRIMFESGHVDGTYADGLLHIWISYEDAEVGQTVLDEVTFSVPADFHSHNDSVAAALMTLAGERFDEVEFNFPISSRCAELLQSHYEGVTVGPVDPSLEPRQRGRRAGLSFSGGVDSTAAWLVMNRAFDGDFVVITSAYGGHFAFEERGYGRYHRDVTCVTNLRARHWDREGRFNCAAPLLYADYLDLATLSTGHTIAHPGTNLGSLRHGGPQLWTRQDAVVQAGGLDELHVMRGIATPGVAKIFMTLGPERIEAALEGSDYPGQRKRYTKELIFRELYADAGLPIPAYLQNTPFPTQPITFGAVPELDYRLLFLIRRGNIDEALRLCPGLAQIDIEPLQKMALNFLGRYCTNLVELLPLQTRIKVMDTFHECDIYPYDERDWHEVGLVQDFFNAINHGQVAIET
ncbi:MAG: hypothetical protein DCC58_11850 [Chloroflexi bacterium]|nr:MAG: hypothetical protein DCC58_11850 [Chloroflexota bacterium]